MASAYAALDALVTGLTNGSNDDFQESVDNILNISDTVYDRSGEAGTEFVNIVAESLDQLVDTNIIV